MRMSKPVCFYSMMCNYLLFCEFMSCLWCKENYLKDPNIILSSLESYFFHQPCLYCPPDGALRPHNASGTCPLRLSSFEHIQTHKLSKAGAKDLCGAGFAVSPSLCLL